MLPLLTLLLLLLFGGTAARVLPSDVGPGDQRLPAPRPCSSDEGAGGVGVGSALCAAGRMVKRALPERGTGGEQTVLYSEQAVSIFDQYFGNN